MSYDLACQGHSKSRIDMGRDKNKYVQTLSYHDSQFHKQAHAEVSATGTIYSNS